MSINLESNSNSNPGPGGGGFDMDNELPDPGDGQDIDVAEDGYMLLVADEEETRNLLEPDHVGQILVLINASPNTVTVTAPDSIDFLGNDTMIFGAQDRHVILVAFPGPRWQLWLNDGAELSGGAVSQDVGTLATAIADPGDGNEIAPTAHGHVVLNGAGTETRDLAPPQFVGQELMLTADNPGDGIAIMAPAIINGSGDQIITFTGQTNTMHLRAIRIGGSPVWRVMFNDGCTLSPAE